MKYVVLTAVLTGETTQGAILSQTFFDLADGYQRSPPVAYDHSHAGGRIEGVGVAPDIEVPADDAMARALDLTRQK